MINRIYSSLWYMQGYKEMPRGELFQKPEKDNTVGQKAMIPPERAFDKVDISELGISLSAQGEGPILNLPPLIANEPEILPDHIVDNRPKRDPNAEGLNIIADPIDLKGLYDFATLEDFFAYTASFPKPSFHKFFDSSTEFFTDAAKEYAKIEKDQEYYNRPTNDSEFINTSLDWLYGTDVTEQDKVDMTSQIDAIVRELAEQIKKGEAADISKLENKLSFRGEEISLSEFNEMKDVTGKLMNEAAIGHSGMGNGASTFERYAKNGLIKSVSSSYFNSIPSNIAKHFGNIVSDILDTQMRIDKDIAMTRGESIRCIVDESEEAYVRMSNLDITDKETLRKSFYQNTNWYKTTLFEQFSDKTAEEDTNALKRILNSLMDMIPNE